jgi:D-glycero-D-manno-heptose 1,7-bisphosphate phosphatase
MKSRAVFLDRDGTIDKDVNFCRRPEDFELLPTAGEAVRLLNNHGFKVIVITNQSGIARGYFNEQTLACIHQKMADELGRYTAKLDAVYYCPHHPDDGCNCRKPKTALFRQAAREMDIELGLSYVVGDSSIDIKAGKALGCRTCLVTTGPKQETDRLSPSDYTADRLVEAAQWIIRDAQSARPNP